METEKTRRLCEMGDKEVIDLGNGARLGYIYDAEIDLETGQVKAFYTPGKARFFGLLGREEDTAILWEDVEKIGDDIILVRRSSPLTVSPHRPRRSGF